MGWPQQQAAYLEALELKQGVPPSHANAARLLRDRGIEVVRIVQVDTDCVLFIGQQGRPRTAWLRRDGARVRAMVEHGFAAWPSDHVLAALGVTPGEAEQPESD